MKILIVNGANLNMLGVREKEIYGENSYRDLVRFIKENARELKLKVKIKQSNIEGEIVNFIQKAYKRYDGIIINAGGYTHTSVVILDALRAVNIKTVEVHLTDIKNREEYRKKSLIGKFAEKTFMGEGFLSYKKALEYFVESEKCQKEEVKQEKSVKKNTEKKSQK